MGLPDHPWIMLFSGRSRTPVPTRLITNIPQTSNLSGYFFVVASLEQFPLKGEMSRSDKGVLRSNEENKINQRAFWSLTLHPSALSGTFPFREGCLYLDCFNFEKTPTKPNLSCRTRRLPTCRRFLNQLTACLKSHALHTLM